MTNFATQATFVDGIMRWKSNNTIPPAEYVAEAFQEGFPVDMIKCANAKIEETKAMLAAYRKAQAERTPEQIAEQRTEARAAMGAGVPMTNIITGERYTT